VQLNAENVIALLTEHLQPKIRVDGGDVEFEKLEGDVIYLGAHADCATCPATAECLKWWCEGEFSRAFGIPCRVVITKHIPYFER
jgi:Fe-S cluster biogenesis protein NfuA